MARIKISKQIREYVYNRDGGICYLCQEPIDRALPHQSPYSYQVEHVNPVSNGGANHPDNYRAAHRRCNSKKGDLPVDVARGKMINEKGASRKW